jgi:hypothetical protein
MNWLTVTSYIQINKRNKDELLSIIKDLHKIEAISYENYQTLLSYAECVQ